jgi:indolepyruvate ferredoxin oxidoreductase beta subunit
VRSEPNKRDQSGWRLALVGTGGQGVLTAARVLCDIFVDRDHYVVSGQLHGMAQRGGSVVSTVAIDAGISPVIPDGKADIVVGLEPVETTRALPLMSQRTTVFMNTAPVVPFVLGQRHVLKQGHDEYPEIGELLKCVGDACGSLHSFDATQCALDVGSLKSLNMVMLGCLLGAGLLPCPADEFWSAAGKTIPRALKTVNANAFARGVELAKDVHLSETGASN